MLWAPNYLPQLFEKTILWLSYGPVVPWVIGRLVLSRTKVRAELKQRDFYTCIPTCVRACMHAYIHIRIIYTYIYYMHISIYLYIYTLYTCICMHTSQYGTLRTPFTEPVENLL